MTFHGECPDVVSHLDCQVLGYTLAGCVVTHPIAFLICKKKILLRRSVVVMEVKGACICELLPIAAVIAAVVTVIIVLANPNSGANRYSY